MLSTTPLSILLLVICVTTTFAQQAQKKTFDVVKPLTNRPWVIDRQFSPSTVAKKGKAKERKARVEEDDGSFPDNGTVDLTLLEAGRTAKFSSGEVGSWGTKMVGVPGRASPHLVIEVPSSTPDGPILQYSLPLTHGKFQPGQAVRIEPGEVRSVSLIKGVMEGKGQIVGKCHMQVQGLGGGISDKAFKRGRKIWWGRVCSNDKD